METGTAAQLFRFLFSGDLWHFRWKTARGPFSMRDGLM